MIYIFTENIAFVCACMSVHVCEDTKIVWEKSAIYYSLNCRSIMKLTIYILTLTIFL